jgi:hypothetical protein
MWRDGWTRGLVFLPIVLILAGCGAEPFRFAPVGTPDAEIPIPEGSGGAPVTADGGGTGGDPAPVGTGGAGVDLASMGSGGAPSVDTAPSDHPDVQPMPDVAPMIPFQCNELIGPSVVNQWGPSFELAMGSLTWQRLAATAAYLEKWADPAAAVWNTPLISPCAAGSTNPDRVLLIAFSTTLNTLEGYRTNITRAIGTIQMKYPGVKRIEVLTTLRAAGNTQCPGKDSITVVPAYVDDAIQAVADAMPGLVTVGPKIEVADCADWSVAGATLVGNGPATVGAAYATYYKAQP